MRSGSLLPGTKSRKVSLLDQRVPHLHIVATVHVDAADAVVGEGAHQIAAFELGRLQAKPAGRYVKRALKRETRREGTKGARWAQARLVGDGTA